MRWVVLTALIAGCGRIDFDLLADAGGVAATCGPWSTPVELTALTTVANDWGPTLRADGLELFWHTQRGGGPGEADFWSATRTSTSGTFGPASVVPMINSVLSDENCTLTQDGLTMFLSSKRNGPYQLFRADRSTVQTSFGTPTVVAELSTIDLRGPELSTGEDELLFTDGNSVTLSRATFDGATFMITGDVAELDLGPETKQASLSADGLTVYYAAVRGSDPASYLYVASRPTQGSLFANETLIAEIRQPGFEDTDPEISADGETLYFSSNRPTGAGNADLYMATRDCP